MPDRLYVVLHGAIGLFEDPNLGMFRAVIPALSPHRVAIGDWLRELTVPKGALLQLTTPVAAKTPKSLDPTQQLVFKMPPGWQLETQSAWLEYAYAEIRLPKPDKIHYFHTCLLYTSDAADE